MVVVVVVVVVVDVLVGMRIRVPTGQLKPKKERTLQIKSGTAIALQFLFVVACASLLKAILEDVLELSLLCVI